MRFLFFLAAPRVFLEMAAKGGVLVRGNSGTNQQKRIFKDKEKPTEVRLSNITAAKGALKAFVWHV